MEGKNGTIKALAFALVIAILGIGILAWQYDKIKKVEIPFLETEIEKQAAYSAIQRFMDFRVEDNEYRANRLMTEVAMEQKLGKEFDLLGSFKDYEIMKVERSEEGNYDCLVKIYDNDMGNIIESIRVIKILDSYYIDSVEIAG